MDYSLIMYKRSVIIHNNEMEIYHAGEIKTREAYYYVMLAVLSYLNAEGFLDDRTTAIDTIHVIDCHGKLINSEELPNEGRAVS